MHIQQYLHIPSHEKAFQSQLIALSENYHPISRRFSTVEAVQYIGGCSVHRGDNISTVGDSFRDGFSTVEVAQYSGGSFSAVGDSFSTVEVVQHSGEITSVHVGVTSVLWRVFSIVEGYLQYCGGITAVHVGG